jgi:hypothetical protein
MAVEYLLGERQTLRTQYLADLGVLVVERLVLRRQDWPVGVGSRACKAADLVGVEGPLEAVC